MNTPLDVRVNIRAVANKWVMNNFRSHRKYLHHCQPNYDVIHDLWQVEIITKDIDGHVFPLGKIKVDNLGEIVYADDPNEISGRINQVLAEAKNKEEFAACIKSDAYKFLHTDGKNLQNPSRIFLSVFC